MQVPLVECKLLLVVHGGISSVFELILIHYFNKNTTKFAMEINYEIEIIETKLLQFDSKQRSNE